MRRLYGHRDRNLVLERIVGAYAVQAGENRLKQRPSSPSASQQQSLFEGDLCQTEVIECRAWACGLRAQQPSTGSRRRASSGSRNRERRPARDPRHATTREVPQTLREGTQMTEELRTAAATCSPTRSSRRSPTRPSAAMTYRRPSGSSSAGHRSVLLVYRRGSRLEWTLSWPTHSRPALKRSSARSARSPARLYVNISTARRES